MFGMERLKSKLYKMWAGKIEREYGKIGKRMRTIRLIVTAEDAQTGIERDSELIVKIDQTKEVGITTFDENVDQNALKYAILYFAMRVIEKIDKVGENPKIEELI